MDNNTQNCAGFSYHEETTEQYLHENKQNKHITGTHLIVNYYHGNMEPH
jgi:hypothetical protein